MNSALLATLSGSLIRWLLTAVGAFVVAHGVLTADDVSAISPGLQEALGGLVSAAALGWSAYQKQHAATTTAAKEIVAVQTGTTTAQRTGEAPSPAAALKAVSIVAADVSQKSGA